VHDVAARPRLVADAQLSWRLELAHQPALRRFVVGDDAQHLSVGLADLGDTAIVSLWTSSPT
jgi:hypothetical protein